MTKAGTMVIFFLIATTLVAAPRRRTNAQPIPKSFRAGRSAQAIQNRQADKDDLTRIKNDKELAELKKKKGRDGRFLLVPLPRVKGLEVKDLDPKWQFVRPWTADFLRDFVMIHRNKFAGKSLELTSAVRTVERQKEIRRHGNGNATVATGKRASLHETGATIDITKIGMTQEEIYWVRDTLRPLHRKTIYVVEEYHQSCFHIMVYKSYKKPKSW